MANVPITSLPLAVAVDGTPYMEIAVNTAAPGSTAVWVSKRCTTQQVAQLFSNNLPCAIEYVLDDGGVTITAGNKGFLRMPFAGTITSASLIGDQSGSVEVDIWKCSYADFDPPSVPTSANSICGGNYPTITAGVKYEDSTLNGWTFTFDEGDVFTYVVNSCSGFTRLTISIEASRTIS